MASATLAALEGLMAVLRKWDYDYEKVPEVAAAEKAIAEAKAEEEKEIRIEWNSGAVSVIRCSAEHVEDVLDLCEIGVALADNGKYNLVEAVA